MYIFLYISGMNAEKKKDAFIKPQAIRDKMLSLLQVKEI